MAKIVAAAAVSALLMFSGLFPVRAAVAGDAVGEPSARIVEFGVYDVVSSPVDQSGAVSGTANAVRGLRLLQGTDRVPARVGVNFGMRFQLIGSAAAYPIETRVVYPKAMVNPETGRSATVETFGAEIKPGPNYHGFTFEHEWELLPGVWRFQIYSRGRLLLEKAFTVYRPGDQV
ncbi:DUF3859 domain-containing protein [Desulfovibrio aminophilus]|uniref:DUF3859 domain-containing protein n=1 Tax=Desulfovibrio aminophilus TaxID=81425 RepID=UPI0033910418